MLENSFVFHISTLKAGNYFEKEQKLKKKKNEAITKNFLKAGGLLFLAYTPTL